ncbi:MAG: hypothetical protein HZY76_07535 [Anaerolineae bacterium]|nr:MAG: hypothetical protein HZY76_07535 [Anaerolineae bacterium]
MTVLFDKFPLRDQVTLSCGPLPQPYHIYDGRGLLIGGLADLAAARSLLAAQNVVPVIAGRPNLHGGLGMRLYSGQPGAAPRARYRSS